MYEELVKRLRNKGCQICPICREAADAIEELQRRLEQALYMPLPHWTSVEEQPPEEWTKVMTYQPAIDYPDGLRRVGVYIGGGKWREAEYHGMMELPVTHWMPLPQSPKEET